jgi:pectinesterase
MNFTVSRYTSALLGLSCAFNCHAQVLQGTAARPHLSAAEAQRYTASAYLAKTGKLGALTTDTWNPSAAVALPSADYRVAADGSAPFKSVQAAVDRAVAGGGARRRYIGIAAGTYRELVCIPSTAPPITLYGLGKLRSDTLIVFNNASPTPKPVGTPTHACAGNAEAAVIGTSGSATVTVRAEGFQARNLSIANDYAAGTYTSPNQSAVALAVRGDKAIFENVAILGNQDTLMVSASDAQTLVRASFKDSLVQGHTDFVCGSGIAVFSHSVIRYDATGPGGSRTGYMFAPSTRPGSVYGFLVVDSVLDEISDGAGNGAYLGRAWDQGIARLTDYVNGSSPNGQVTIRDSVLGAHLRNNAPWAASTARRPFCSAGCTYSANRFYEYANTGAGSAN